MYSTQIEMLFETGFFFSVLYTTLLFSASYSIDTSSPIYWELVTRLSSSVHAALATCLVFLCQQNEMWIVWLYTNSLVYILLESAVLYYKRRALHVDRYMVAHHLLFFTGLNYGIWIQYSPYVVSRLLLTEVSTPFLNYAWSVYKQGMTQHNHTEVHLAKLLLLTTYITGRIINTIHLTVSNPFNWISIPQIYIVGFMCINLFWFVKILRKV